MLYASAVTIAGTAGELHHLRARVAELQGELKDTREQLAATTRANELNLELMRTCKKTLVGKRK